ncbi:MAG: ribonuclease H family protein [Bacteroidetes bacterium]|nr:ribonuclease H family protein [Bacteroidota bacterium]
MSNKPKYYVVWHGRETGIFDTWEACKELIDGFPAPVYKSFSTKALAEMAFASDSSYYVGKESLASQLSEEKLFRLGTPRINSIVVKGARDNTTGLAEYQGLFLKTGEVLFHQGPFEDGTNNIVEFLAIVHALAYCKEMYEILPIYSESTIAMGWVQNVKAKNIYPPSDKNIKLFNLLARAEKWLQNNEYDNPVLKWETKYWGENPADFGRK